MVYVFWLYSFTFYGLFIYLHPFHIYFNTGLYDYNFIQCLINNLLKLNFIPIYYSIVSFLSVLNISNIFFSLIAIFMSFFNSVSIWSSIAEFFFNIYWSPLYINIVCNFSFTEDLIKLIWPVNCLHTALSVFEKNVWLFLSFLDFVFSLNLDLWSIWVYIIFSYDPTIIVDMSLTLASFSGLAIMFLFAPILSLFFLSYLSLYGVLIFNLIVFFLFWCNVVSHFEDFFFDNQHLHFIVGSWFSLLGYDSVTFEFYVDTLSYSYILLTLTIAVFVYVYTFSYFRYEPNVERLLIFIHLFVVSMLILVSSGNLFVLFLGWELIGLTSFFLINFWSTRIATLKSAFKAFVFNKFSDVSLFIFILVSFNCTHDISILVFNAQIPMYQTHSIKFLSGEYSSIEIMSFFLLSAAFIKSAQFGAHIWLPDSMEAPVPASALIHSATLVSAGVFLVLRFNPLLELSVYAYNVITVIGSFTAFFGACGAMFQSDAKRILAYSTISHCGFLMVTTAVRIPELTVFYLYVHGFFKASIFLCIGNIIRFNLNLQDFRRMGGFAKYLPFECIMVFICLVNLSGLPFSLGFLIKHVFLTFLNYNSFLGYWVVVNILGGAIFGLIYSYRLYYYIFFDFKKNKKHVYTQTNRNELSSKYYSNTTLASNTAIMVLTFVGYAISLFLYMCFFNKCSFSDSLDIVSKTNSQYYNLHWSSVYFLNFLSQVNWFVLQVVFILIFSVWRRTYNSSLVLNSVFNVFVFSIFFFLAVNLLLL